MSGFATPGFDGMFAGTVVSERLPSSVFIDETNSLKPEMPASPVVAPSSYLPKIATTLRTLSSQILLYSGNLPVVESGEGATVASTFTTSASATWQLELFGR